MATRCGSGRATHLKPRSSNTLSRPTKPSEGRRSDLVVGQPSIAKAPSWRASSTAARVSPYVTPWLRLSALTNRHGSSQTASSSLRSKPFRRLLRPPSDAVRKPWLWVEDVYVDLGLLTLVRAEATLTDGRLITKREALTRLDRFGVPEDLVREIAHRRQGDSLSLTTLQRVRRAGTARRLVARGIASLL